MDAVPDGDVKSQLLMAGFCYLPWVRASGRTMHTSAARMTNAMK
jgi:hypothetical protein